MILPIAHDAVTPPPKKAKTSCSPIERRSSTNTVPILFAGPSLSRNMSSASLTTNATYSSNEDSTAIAHKHMVRKSNDLFANTSKAPSESPYETASERTTNGSLISSPDSFESPYPKKRKTTCSPPAYHNGKADIIATTDHPSKQQLNPQSSSSNSADICNPNCFYPPFEFTSVKGSELIQSAAYAQFIDEKAPINNEGVQSKPITIPSAHSAFTRVPARHREI